MEGNPNLEFHAQDDCWYYATVSLNQEILTAKLFMEDTTEIFCVSDFTTEALLQKLMARFRLPSLPLQDQYCGLVGVGTKVCASQDYSCGVEFHDATVEKIIQDHKEENGKIVCKCLFTLRWANGPDANMATMVTVERICVAQIGREVQDPALVSFFGLVRKQLDSQASSKRRKSKEATTSGEGMTKQKFTGGSVQKKLRHDMASGSVRTFATESIWFYVIIENIEKDVSASNIVNFISQHTSSTYDIVYMSPSSLTNTCVRATIFVKSKAKLEELHGFLNNSSHLILSSKGRPWLIGAKQQSSGVFNGSIDMSEKSSDKTGYVSEKIKVVLEGTNEYNLGRLVVCLFTNLCESFQSLDDSE